MSVAQTPTRTNGRAELIEAKIDKVAASRLSISAAEGGMAFRDMGEVLEFAKLMAVSLQAVPPHCRNQPGVCLGISIQAIEWMMSPFSVANKSYVVNDRLGYESQLIHAVIEQRAPIKERLRHEFTGAGDKRQCVVWATAKGESEPLKYTSPEFGRIQPKNSPLWKTKPDLQLYYNTSRDWARMYFPDVILGVYSKDELEDAMPGSQSVDRPRGIAGLKQQLVSAAPDEPEQDQDTIEAQDDSGDVDQTGPEDDGNQDMGDPSKPTAEERAEMEAAASGQLFDSAPVPSKVGH